MFIVLFLLVVVANAYPGMVEEEAEASYSLRCPDDSLAVAKGLHACCEEPPFVYCTLCARIEKGYVTTCVTNCNGTVIQEEPYCTNCLCRPILPQEAPIQEERPRYEGCPYMKAKKEL